MRFVKDWCFCLTHGIPACWNVDFKGNCAICEYFVSLVKKYLIDHLVFQFSVIPIVTKVRRYNQLSLR